MLEFQTHVCSAPILTDSQGHKASSAPSFTHRPCPKPYPFTVSSQFCVEGRKRVILIEPFRVLSNQGKLRQRNPASILLQYLIGTCLMKKVLPSCGCLLNAATPGPVMCVRTVSLQFYRNGFTSIEISLYSTRSIFLIIMLSDIV